MQKIRYLLSALALLVTLSAACSVPTSITTITPSIPTFGFGQPTQPHAIDTSGIQPTTSRGAGSQAPHCEAAASCAALNAVQIPLACVKKVPYTNVLVPTGTTFQVLDTSGQFTCIDSGVVQNGQQVLTCHGKELFAFQLKLTNAACGTATLATGTGQCEEGYGYDAAQQCCAPVTGGSAGSTIVTVNLGGCPLPNP